jgi:hypothetical protein
MFFGEDIVADGSPPVPPDRRLTLETNPVLVHEIATLFSLPTLVRNLISAKCKLKQLSGRLDFEVVSCSGVLFIAGVIAFVATVDFQADISAKCPTALLAIVSLFPSVAYLCFFWFSYIWCSMEHRRFRRAMCYVARD